MTQTWSFENMNLLLSKNVKEFKQTLVKIDCITPARSHHLKMWYFPNIHSILRLYESEPQAQMIPTDYPKPKPYLINLYSFHNIIQSHFAPSSSMYFSQCMAYELTGLCECFHIVISYAHSIYMEIDSLVSWYMQDNFSTGLIYWLLCCVSWSKYPYIYFI